MNGSGGVEVPPRVWAATVAAPGTGEAGIVNVAVVPVGLTVTEPAGIVAVEVSGNVTTIDVPPGTRSDPLNVTLVPPATGPWFGVSDAAVGTSAAVGGAHWALASTIVPTLMAGSSSGVIVTSRTIEAARTGAVVSISRIVALMSATPATVRPTVTSTPDTVTGVPSRVTPVAVATAVPVPVTGHVTLAVRRPVLNSCTPIGWSVMATLAIALDADVDTGPRWPSW